MSELGIIYFSALTLALGTFSWQVWKNVRENRVKRLKKQGLRRQPG